MDYKKELFELQEYCKASVNFITDNDSIEDRYARQAYKDVVNKIVGIFERALAENTPTSEESNCNTHLVSGSALLNELIPLLISYFYPTTPTFNSDEMFKKRLHIIEILNDFKAD